jgi:RNA polymerase sigma factor (sigma-70 family)
MSDCNLLRIPPAVRRRSNLVSKSAGTDRGPRPGSTTSSEPKRSPRDSSELKRSPRDSSELKRSPRDSSELKRSPRLLASASFPGRAPLLTAEQERALAVRIKRGDDQARRALIESNLRLVVAISRGYSSPGMTRDDLIQEGNRGLIRAARDFDPDTHNVRFASYASYWIRNAIQRAIAQNCSLIRLPDYLVMLRGKYHRVVGELRCEEQLRGDGVPADLGPESIASRMKISARRYENLKRSMFEWAPFTATDSDGEGWTRQEMVADLRTPERDLEEAEESAALQAALQRLSPFEIWLIRHRFGLVEDAEPDVQPGGESVSNEPASGPRRGTQPRRQCSYSELAEACGLSKSQVRRLEQHALEKLRGLLDPEVLAEPIPVAALGRRTRKLAAGTRRGG